MNIRRGTQYMRGEQGFYRIYTYSGQTEVRLKGKVVGFTQKIGGEWWTARYFTPQSGGFGSRKEALKFIAQGLELAALTNKNWQEFKGRIFTGWNEVA